MPLTSVCMLTLNELGTAQHLYNIGLLLIVLKQWEIFITQKRIIRIYDREGSALIRVFIAHNYNAEVQ